MPWVIAYTYSLSTSNQQNSVNRQDYSGKAIRETTARRATGMVSLLHSKAGGGAYCSHSALFLSGCRGTSQVIQNKTRSCLSIAIANSIYDEIYQK